MPLLRFLNEKCNFSRTSKAFTPQITMKSCQCEDIYVQLMNVGFLGIYYCNIQYTSAIFYVQGFLNALNPGSASSEPLLNGLRQYLHRMIISLANDQMLPCLPLIIQKFIAIIHEARMLQDFLTLVQQAIMKYKVGFMYLVKPKPKNDFE